MSHTPGPWIYNHPYIETEGMGGLKVIVADFRILSANANLIAAAPDLLEACEAVVSQYGNDDLTLYEQHAIGLMVKDAIAKAKPIGDE